MSKYPEHEKMRAVKAKSQALGSFLEWLDYAGYAVCEYSRGDYGQDYYRTGKNIEQLLADYFEIDLRKISAEKDAMYAELTGARDVDATEHDGA